MMEIAREPNRMDPFSMDIRMLVAYRGFFLQESESLTTNPSYRLAIRQRTISLKFSQSLKCGYKKMEHLETPSENR